MSEQLCDIPGYNVYVFLIPRFQIFLKQQIQFDNLLAAYIFEEYNEMQYGHTQYIII